MLVDGEERVDEAGTIAALRGMIDRAPEGRFLVVGPPPVAWDEINELIAARSAAIAAVCAEAGVPFVPTYDTLRADETWMDGVASPGRTTRTSVWGVQVTALKVSRSPNAEVTAMMVAKLGLPSTDSAL